MPFHRIFRMGCGVSKIDANGVATPNRILPNFPTRRRHNNKECKKEPLLMMMNENPDDQDHHIQGNRISISALKPYCDDHNSCCVIPDGSKKLEDKKRAAKIRAIVQEDEKNGHREDVEDVGGKDDDIDDRRAINKIRVAREEDGDAYPGSPSFRVYFDDKDVESKKNDGNKEVGLKDITPVTTTIPSTKENSVRKDEKKEIRKKSFRSVISKNLKNIRSSSNSSARVTHNHHFS